MVFVDGVLGGRADLPMSDDKVVEQTKGEKGIRSKAVLKDAMQYLSEERVLDGDIVAISFMKEEEDDGDMLIVCCPPLPLISLSNLPTCFHCLFLNFVCLVI
ncbi:hypothetical protein ERO13_D12G277550v2 [Gossypium hirsutum]|uniref:Uncharacterized protein n=4 Tax=Gossypium TaxID=3633 RepID=A0A5J5P906_GOSBA|nr:hypothetical protein ES319_D12G306600v1 [Gossypium barbadense]KAG4118190.1 hypothetical protein ERO13_D12G277550v2 [Gossypium hirsutum]TYG43228.1 hypothetical protein ES288_D12G320100v1 [Gossypium darwinii]TYH41535.1 hypothetical protein ES332_D12G323500v1 [Gossypium tomentosum]TYI53371.1 hypothetical protein E1A91_D12G313700v1 [Gossypium mustelinum]